MLVDAHGVLGRRTTGRALTRRLPRRPHAHRLGVGDTRLAREPRQRDRLRLQRNALRRRAVLCDIFMELFAEHGRPLSAQEYFDELAGLSDPRSCSRGSAATIPTSTESSASACSATATRSPTARRSTTHVREAVAYAADARAARNLLRRRAGRDRAGRRRPPASAQLLRGIVSSDDVIDGKPHPEGYLQALGLLRRRPPRRGARDRRHRGGRRVREGRRTAHVCEDRHARPAPARRGRRAVDRIDVELMRRVLG